MLLHTRIPLIQHRSVADDQRLGVGSGGQHLLLPGGKLR